MKKWILLIMVVLVIPVVAARLDLCEETIPIHTNCTMVSPIIYCAAYTYEIFNLSGEVVTSGSLSVLKGNMYYFNFTEPAGDYIVRLCDDTTKEVRVVLEEGNNMIISIMLALILLTCVFGYLAVQYKDTPLQILYFMACLWFLVGTVGIGTLLARAYTDVPGIVIVMSSIFLIVGLIAVFTTFYVLVQYTKAVLFYRAKKKDEEHDSK